MRMRAAIADELNIMLHSYGFCVADVVYFSSPHQRSGKSGNGDSGKRNEDRRENIDLAIFSGLVTIAIMILVEVAQWVFQKATQIF